MNADKVIEVLEEIKNDPFEPITTDGAEALTQAINLIKENGELKEGITKALDKDEATKILKYRIEELQQELADLKKAVASEGLGVEEIENVMLINRMPQDDNGFIVLSKEGYEKHLRELAERIHEAQTKYKKDKGEAE